MMRRGEGKIGTAVTPRQTSCEMRGKRGSGWGEDYYAKLSCYLKGPYSRRFVRPRTRSSWRTVRERTGKEGLAEALSLSPKDWRRAEWKKPWSKEICEV